jgi:Transglutaminase-like superfamily
MPRYGLARHVFVCRNEEYIVVLDVRRDRYFALEAARTAALIPLLPGWPALRAANDAGVGAEIDATEAAAPLIRQGWLLESSSDAKEATPTSVRPSESELLTELDIEDARIGVRAVIGFVWASITARFALRFWRLERVILRVRSRKVARSSTAPPLDVARARLLVDTFARLRVFLFSHRNKCLQDSLALLEFLAHYDIFPDWVFAVRARPFVAHCWVQHQDLVFNDTAEHVGAYTPIMVI